MLCYSYIYDILYSLRDLPSPPTPHQPTKNSCCAPAVQYEMKTRQYKFLNKRGTAEGLQKLSSYM
jgi:hypothetical protein